MSGPYRVLTRAIRGHRYLVGNPNVHPIGDAPPAGVGTLFATVAEAQNFVTAEHATISSIVSAEILDSADLVVWHGQRGGFNATGQVWDWTLVAADCDHCHQPMRRDSNGWWVGADETSDCPAAEGGHEVGGSPR